MAAGTSQNWRHRLDEALWGGDPDGYARQLQASNSSGAGEDCVKNGWARGKICGYGTKCRYGMNDVCQSRFTCPAGYAATEREGAASTPWLGGRRDSASLIAAAGSH